MLKKDKSKILIIVLYFLSLLIFELIIGIILFDGDTIKVVEGYYDFFDVIASSIKAGIYHFIFISCLAIYVKFSKKIDIEYKHIIYWFPLCTFLFSLPISCLASTIVSIFIHFLDMFI